MTWLCPELNPAFRDFNFSSLIDPALPVLVPAARVSELLERGQDHEVADIIMTTLRNGSFEAYQRTHGPRPLDYADWCVYKTAQFLDLLSCGYQPDELLKESPDARLPKLPWWTSCGAPGCQKALHSQRGFPRLRKGLRTNRRAAGGAGTAAATKSSRLANSAAWTAPRSATHWTAKPSTILKASRSMGSPGGPMVGTTPTYARISSNC